jgi:hypothetical protein
LIEEGANPAVNDWALLWAVERENTNIVKVLLEAGTDPKTDDSLFLIFSSFCRRFH